MSVREEKNKDVVRQFTDAMNRREFDRLDEWFAPDLVRHCQESCRDLGDLG